MAGKFDDQLGEGETAKRRDAAVPKALKTPPKTLKQVIGKRRGSPKSKPRISRHQGR